MSARTYAESLGEIMKNKKSSLEMGKESFSLLAHAFNHGKHDPEKNLKDFKDAEDVSKRVNVAVAATKEHFNISDEEYEKSMKEAKGIARGFFSKTD